MAGKNNTTTLLLGVAAGAVGMYFLKDTIDGIIGGGAGVPVADDTANRARAFATRYQQYWLASRGYGGSL